MVTASWVIRMVEKFCSQISNAHTWLTSSFSACKSNWSVAQHGLDCTLLQSFLITSSSPSQAFKWTQLAGDKQRERGWGTDKEKRSQTVWWLQHIYPCFNKYGLLWSEISKSSKILLNEKITMNCIRSCKVRHAYLKASDGEVADDKCQFMGKYSSAKNEWEL